MNKILFKKKYKKRYKEHFIKKNKIIKMLIRSLFALCLFLHFSNGTFLQMNSSYLRSLELEEETRVKNHFIEKGIHYIQSQMIQLAKNGYSELTIEDCNTHFHHPLLIEHDASITPKNYNYLKPEIIQSISDQMKELCIDCVQSKKYINNCTLYTIYW